MVMDAIRNLVGRLETRNFTEPPEGVMKGVSNNLKEDERIIFTLLDWRAIYKAPRFTDSNTFFNSWFILTNERILIAKHSSEFKRFRDIPLSGITDIYYELRNRDPRITITTPGNVDIIEFPKRAAEHTGDLEEALGRAVENARKAAPNPVDADFMHCGNCGGRILRSSHFCSECGVRIEAARV